MSENTNRAFLYGESVFTTMRMIDDYIRDWEYHFDRLKKGVEFLFGPFSDDNWVPLLKERLEAKCSLEKGDKVLRLTIYLDQGRGVSRNRILSLMDLKVSLMATPLDPYRLKKKSLSLRTCSANVRPHWWPPYLKAGNYLETIIAQKMYLKPGDDDLLFLSRGDTILESSVANIFVVRHNKLYTPPVGPNVLDGVMRKKVLEVALDYFDDYEESETTVDQLYKADGIFGSNSVRGLFLVDRVDDYEINLNQEFMLRFEGLRNKVYE